MLLYDRLVMPMYTDADDRGEKAYLLEKGWNHNPQSQRASREKKFRGKREDFYDFQMTRLGGGIKSEAIVAELKEAIGN